MSIDNFIPELWAADILSNLHKTLIFAQPGVCNRNYEGEIKERGDTVRIHNIGPVTVTDYTKNTDLSSPEALTDGEVVLTITEQKSFNFQVDDIDKVQGNPQVMSEGTKEAAYAIGNGIDAFIAAKWTEFSTGNYVGTVASPKTLAAAADLYPFFVQMMVKLDEANVPREGRYACIPPWAQGVMAQDSRFVLNLDPSTYGTIRNGMIGRTAGFDLLLSNNVALSGSDYAIPFGHPMGITFAEQVTQTEAYRPEKRFADALKGLTLYGGKVVRPQAMGALIITRNTAIA